MIYIEIRGANGDGATEIAAPIWDRLSPCGQVLAIHDAFAPCDGRSTFRHTASSPGVTPMIPLEFRADIKLPHYGVCGDTFDTMKAARGWIAEIIRTHRRGRICQYGNVPPMRLRSLSYRIRPQLLEE